MIQLQVNCKFRKIIDFSHLGLREHFRVESKVICRDMKLYLKRCTWVVLPQCVYVIEVMKRNVCVRSTGANVSNLRSIAGVESGLALCVLLQKSNES